MLVMSRARNSDVTDPHTRPDGGEGRQLTTPSTYRQRWPNPLAAADAALEAVPPHRVDQTGGEDRARGAAAASLAKHHHRGGAVREDLAIAGQHFYFDRNWLRCHMLCPTARCRNIEIQLCRTHDAREHPVESDEDNGLDNLCRRKLGPCTI